MTEDIDINGLQGRFLAQTKIRLGILRLWIERKMIPWRINAKGHYTRDLDGELIPEYTPSNLSEFCEWEWNRCSDSPPPVPELLQLKKYSRTNFYQPYHADLAKEVKAALKNIVACRVLQLETHNKNSILTTQHATIKYLENVIKNQESETRAARLALSKHTREERSRTHLLRLRLKELEKHVKEVEARNAELTLTLTKIIPLRSAK